MARKTIDDWLVKGWETVAIPAGSGSGITATSAVGAGNLIVDITERSWG